MKQQKWPERQAGAQHRFRLRPNSGLYNNESNWSACLLPQPPSDSPYFTRREFRNVPSMFTQPSLEIRLLFACSRLSPDRDHIANLLKQNPDWDSLIRMAARFGLLPILYNELRPEVETGRVPDTVGELLKQCFRRDTIHDLARRELLRNVLRRFARADVEAIVMKGTALATLTYPSSVLRPMDSVKLLVRAQDCGRIESLLFSDNEGDDAAASIRPQDRRLLNIGHDPFRAVPNPPAIPVDDFWNRARPVEIGGAPAWSLAPEDQLLYLTIHLTAGSGFIGEFRALRDLGEVCRQYADTIDWPILVARAQAFGQEKPLYFSLCLARDWAAANVPELALQDLRKLFKLLPLEHRLITAATHHALCSEEPLKGFPRTLYDLALRLLKSANTSSKLYALTDKLKRSRPVLLRRLAATSTLTVRNPAVKPGGVPRAGSDRPDSRPFDRAKSPAELAVTYDQNAYDGVGAQIQRIYGIYATARALGIKYVHSPIGHIDYQGMMPLLEGRKDPGFTERCNALFAVPSDPFDLNTCDQLNISYLNKDLVEQFRQQTRETGRSLLVRCHDAYAYSDRYPESYRVLRSISPYRDHQPKGPIRICIHMRRGDQIVARDPRLLPNAYFIRCCRTVIDVLLERGADFVVRLHTEVPPRAYTLHPGISGVYCRLDEPSTIDPKSYGLEDFDILPNLEKVLNLEPLEALAEFATADVLILSLSSFGYVGGLLNPHGLVISAPDFHAPLPDWLLASTDGELDRVQVEARLTKRATS